MQLSGLYIYPIKSLAGISLAEAGVEERGLFWDRRWMLVNEQNQFLTQRNFPRMALLHTQITGDELAVKVVDEEIALHIGLNEGTGSYISSTLWDDQPGVELIGKHADDFFSTFLQMPVRLVRVGSKTSRPADPRYVPDRKVEVSLADGYPFLVIGQASLDDLNQRLDTPVPMDRFRPNFVVEGAPPYAEDQWKKIRIGDAFFRVVKPCARCVVTTIDQATAKQGKEPLRTLSTYRTVNNKVIFGQNMILESGHTVRLGDKIEILE